MTISILDQALEATKHLETLENFTERYTFLIETLNNIACESWQEGVDFVEEGIVG